jgi:hypothetical protein
MPYADYNFYINSYFGKAIESEQDFKFYASVGAEYISASTLGKATIDNLQVKKCNCRVADILHYNHGAGAMDKKIKQSENVGSWNITYDNSTNEEVERQISNAIRLYLLQTGLLYRGV